MKILVDGMSRDKGGIGSLLLNFAIYSKQVPVDQQIQFTFLLPSCSEYQQDLEKLGDRYYTVPSITRMSSYRKVIKKVFQEDTYDYLWLNNTSKVNRFLPVYASKMGAKLITHPHGVAGEEQGIKKLIFSFVNWFNYPVYMQLMKLPFACSEEAARTYYRNEDILRNATVINNGIFVDKFRYSRHNRKSIREVLSIQDGDVVLGTMGRLSAVKNHGFLISLLTELPVNYRCIILGSGEDRDALEQMAAEKGVQDRLLLAGQVENVHEYLSAFDIFVMPSLHEGMPYAVIEAQAAGLPCVVSHTVSNEVRLSDLVAFAELNSLDDWKKHILSAQTKTEERSQYADVIRKSGYSIEESYSTFWKTVANHD